MKILILVAWLFSMQSFAGNEGGHGGVGVRDGDKVYILDLYEAGLHLTPYFDPRVEVAADILSRVSANFSENPDPSLILLARKLTEIRRVAPVIAFALLRALEVYHLKFTSEELFKTYDEDSTIVIPPERRVQLAVRKSKSIFINQKEWVKLDIPNRATLILHEMIYAFYNETSRLSSSNSFRTREVVAYIMSNKFSSRNPSMLNGFKTVLGHDSDFSFGESRFDDGATKGTFGPLRSKRNSPGRLGYVYRQVKFSFSDADGINPVDQRYAARRSNFLEVIDTSCEEALINLKKHFSTRSGTLWFNLVLELDFKILEVNIIADKAILTETRATEESFLSRNFPAINGVTALNCQQEIVDNTESLEKMQIKYLELTTKSWD